MYKYFIRSTPAEIRTQTSASGGQRDILFTTGAY